MATIDNNLLIGDTSKNLGIPKTRRGVEQLLIKTLRDKYGLVKNEDVSYGTIRRKYRKYSSKAVVSLIEEQEKNGMPNMMQM